MAPRRLTKGRCHRAPDCRAACRLALLAAGLSACDADSKSQLVTVDDSGTLDISADGTGLSIRVAFDSECLSSSCDEVQMATCSASVIVATVAGSNTTLPIYVFSSIRRGITPEVNAIGSSVLGVSLTLMILAQALLRARTPKRGQG